MRSHGGQVQALCARWNIQWTGPWHDFSVSLSPAGIPPSIQELGVRWLELATAYPEPDAEVATRALSDAHNLRSSQVICGNGSLELMGLVLLATGAQRAWFTKPCWPGYEEACAFAGVSPVSGSFENAGADEVVFLASPRNPDGDILSADWVRDFCARHPQTWVLLDLAFDDFVNDPADSPWWQGSWPARLVRVKSLTKFFCIPGLRLGFLAVGDGADAERLYASLQKRSLPWSLNGFAQWCAPRLYTHPQWMTQTRSVIAHSRSMLADTLMRYGFSVRVAPAWVLVELSAQDAQAWQRRLLEHGIGVRLWMEEQSPTAYLRFGLLPTESIQALENALQTCQNLTAFKVKSPAHCPALCIAGTTSHAGKSSLATGFCALWRAQGLHPLPFKAQNMSNQAWVTPQGGEIGWAQAVQAFAAGVVPHVDMNPVLLKPCGAGLSHVIHRGVDCGPISTQQYYTDFSEHRRVALAALDALALRAGSLILEGAGGLAETNLRTRDLSNRAAPLHVGAKILLVGDIERGGVFASLYGSYACLDPLLQQRVAGFAINRFRGDASLLDSGITELEARTGRPVLGVIPWSDELRLGEEDSLAYGEDELPPQDGIRIGIVRLPHLANGNDWAPLEYMPGVRVFYSSDAQKLSSADALILPGTRHTISDLQWLRAQGLADFICAWSAQGKPLLAICGGLQMLGSRVSDPDGVESAEGTECPGLGLMPWRTEMQKEGKIVRPCRGQAHAAVESALPWCRHLGSLEGYEIHCGKSIPDSHWPATLIPWLGGAINYSGTMWATYWHGLFHQGPLAERWVTMIAQQAQKSWHREPRKMAEPLSSVTPDFLRGGIAVAENLVAKHLRWRELLP